MSAGKRVAALLAGAQQAAAEQRRLKEMRAARMAWAERTAAALMAAQKRADEAWNRILDALPDDLDEEELARLPVPPEQAEADALWAQIEAMCDHDRWPKELYWSL